MRTADLGVMVLLSCLATAACGDDTSSAGSGGSGAGSGTGSGASGVGGADGGQDPECEAYLDCVAEVTPEALPDALEAYGADGDCWADEPSAEQCVTACRAGLTDLRQTDPTCGPESSDVRDGRYQLVVATTVQSGAPIVWEAIVTTSADATFRMDLQPLDADDWETPVGEPQTVGPFPTGSGITTSSFAFGVPAEANFSSGGAIAGEMAFTETKPLESVFLCGDVTGSLTAPLASDLAGSIFTMQPWAEGSPRPDPIVSCMGEGP